MQQFFGKYYSKNGFSVIELAIVLVLVGFLLTIIGTGVLSYIELSQSKSSDTNLRVVKAALKGYEAENGHLPCPADPSLDINNANYGIAVTGCEALACWASGTWTGACLTDSDLRAGMIPTQTLGLPDSMSLDGLENKFTYIIENTQAANSCKSNGQTTRSAYIKDASGNNIAQPFCFTTSGTPPTVDSTSLSRIGSPSYLLISHGKNEVGAWNKNGTRTACSGAGKDLENCDDDSIFTSTLKNPVAGADYFDDKIVWDYTKDQEKCPAGISSCAAWLDAADRCSMAVDSSDNITNLYDKLTRGTCGASPSASITNKPSYNATKYNNLPAISFDGTEEIDLFDASIATNDMDIFIVAKAATGATHSSENRYLIYPRNTQTDVSNSAGIGIAIGSDDIVVYEEDGSALSNASSSASSSEVQLIRVSIDSNLVARIYINETINATGTASGDTPLYLFFDKLGHTSNGFEGDFFELIAYDGALEQHEANKISAYLKDKWKIQY